LRIYSVSGRAVTLIAVFYLPTTVYGEYIYCRRPLEKMKVKNSLSLYSLGAQELEEIIEKELVRKLFKF